LFTEHKITSFFLLLYEADSILSQNGGLVNMNSTLKKVILYAEAKLVILSKAEGSTHLILCCFIGKCEDPSIRYRSVGMTET
jgi:hypothetical protein